MSAAFVRRTGNTTKVDADYVVLVLLEGSHNMVGHLVY